jgi:signal transduction histidine kinase
MTMFRSLRARLVAWSSALLVVALVACGTLVAYSTWSAWLRDVDRGLATRMQTLTTAIRPAADGAFDVVVPADVLPNPDRDYYGLWDGQGRVIVASHPDVAEAAPAEGLVLREARREQIARLPSGMTVMVGRRIDNLESEIRRLVVAMTGVGVFALALVLGGGWWMVGRGLAPIERISHTARSMIDGDLGARIPIPRVESELALLAGVLNEAFDRLYTSLERQRQFTADASHDLRTPLTTLQTEAHWALARPRSVEEYRASLEVCQRAAVRMQGLVQSLLELARAESASDPVRSLCPVSETITAVVRDLRPMAEARQVTVTTGEVSGVVAADPISLMAAVTNLVTNAIQYNVEGGTVVITSTVSDGWVEVAVQDTGVGLDAHHTERVFDRFYRVDASRHDGTGGAGLGLAVVAAFARSHGGSATVSSTPARGSTFRLRLPHQQK